ncbi:uncharacterized protein LOC126837569, partial [Adelges cooleyi]|uniref:uncharacterized protein LOC126837569 n=1 Tax=Adelges cooleyi TaxID=133065 RepID=UPI00217F6131
FIILSDSLIYLIKTKDFYEDVRKKPELLNRMDTSNLSPDHPCYSVERKKVPGTFTDELAGLTMHEIIALRSKLYGFSKENIYKSLETEWNTEEKIKAKGIRTYVTQKHMVLDDFKRCLFDDDSDDAYRENISIRSFKHQICTIKTMKLALNRNDDKRIILHDRIHTLAIGHYKIKELQEAGGL